MVFKKDDTKEILNEILRKLEKIENDLEILKRRIANYGMAEIYFDDENRFKEFVDFCSSIMKKDKTFNFDADERTKTVRIYSLTRGLLISKLNWIINHTNFKDIKFKIID